MLSGEAKFARVRNGLPHFAEVALELEFPTENAEIQCACAGNGFVRQGYIEDVPSNGYEDWKAGGRAGVDFALSVAALPPARVKITRISGMGTDTNPTVVGAAAAFALWRAAGFSPAPHIVEQLEAVVFTSWQRAPDEIPRFK